MVMVILMVTDMITIIIHQDKEECQLHLQSQVTTEKCSKIIFIFLLTTLMYG